MDSYINQALTIIQDQMFLRDLQRVRGELQSLGVSVNIQYSPRSNSMILYKLFIKECQRNSGRGTRAMVILTSLADQYNKKISLTPSDIFGSDLERLIKFYETFGFQRNPHPKISERYLRFPVEID